MKKTKILVIVTLLIITLSACQANPTTPPSNQIYLYGEAHDVIKILDKEFELWREYYKNEGMRHLFIESPYYTAEFLNLWMQSDNDDIFDAIYTDWDGTMSHSPNVKEFYKKIKTQCPETIFHGTDVGHQYLTTGKRFLNHLKEKNLEKSEQYKLAQTAIEQGKYYYANNNEIYRENKMIENFIYEFDKLKNENVMGIYGAAHTGLDAMDYTTSSVPCMANQLKQYYDDNLHSEDLSMLAKLMDPERLDKIKIDDKEYEASYFGQADLTGFKDYKCREFWRLENAYTDFKDNPLINDTLPANNYPMLIEVGQVFVIDYTKTDGSVKRVYLRSDAGNMLNGMISTQEFSLE